jgi:predicted amidohydrolase YtcJ
MRFLAYSLVFFLISSCIKGKKVDLIVHNARIHVMDDNNTVLEAMAVHDGKIVEVGPERQILNKYRSEEEIDAKGKDVYPGLTDAHGHLFAYAKQKLTLDLTNCKSFNELLVRCEKYTSRTGKKFIVGRGWDQSLWATKEMPTYEELNKRFPDIDVLLYRIDGHAALVNKHLFERAKISAQTKIEGGLIGLTDGETNGILLDNAIQLVEKFIPEVSKTELKNSLLEIQTELFQFGITGVHEAGINLDELNILKNLVQKNELKLNVYAMLLPSNQTFDFVRKKGHFRLKNLSVRSFKVYADGALGSRGALLKQPYHDAEHEHGLLLTSIKKMQEVADFCLQHNYQMNTHGIGDSANALILDIYKKAFELNRDHRFRVEHAQVVDPVDFQLFSKYAVFPSVQPTHAVSDQRWAENRLGKERLKGAYAYKSLLNQYGMLAIGTDFPVELTNPFLTIHAAVQRKNSTNQPINGFLPNESLTLEEVMKGMTIWAAFAAFQERTEGTLEKGKNATFVIFERPLTSSYNFTDNYSWRTYINGQKVHSLEDL